MPIFYLVPARQTSGIDEYLGFWGRDMAPRVRVVHYEDIPALTALAPGTYILAALDQLDPDTLRFVRDLHRHFDGRRGFRFLNHPASTLHRLPLLNELHRRGLNDFRAVPAGGDLEGLRFPVFLRSSRAHDGAISPLLRSVGEIEDAIGRAAFRGRRLRELLVVEFCATADEDGRYRKYAAFRVGGRIVPRHVVCGRDWMLKLDGGESSASAVQEELEYVRDNPHRRALAEIFRIANVEYGRIDYSLQGDRVQTWEINLNPVIGPAVSPVHRGPKNQLFYGAFRAALERLDCTPRGSSAVPVPAAASRRAPSAPPATSPTARGLRARFEPARPLIEPLLRPLFPWVGRLARRLSAD